MEDRLGADFSQVRLHAGSAARASAAWFDARAYTVGRHIVIGEGGEGKRTLAHELTHVIQQLTGPVAGTDIGGGVSVSDPSDPFERQADAHSPTRASPARQAIRVGGIGGELLGVSSILFSTHLGMSWQSYLLRAGC